MKRIKAACITQTLCFEEISVGQKIIRYLDVLLREEYNIKVP